MNGIDQYLYNNNAGQLYPWGIGRRTHAVDFVVESLPGNVEKGAIICGISVKNNSDLFYGFGLMIYADGRMQYRVGREQGAANVPVVCYGATVFRPGKMYRVEVDIAADGTYEARVNGVTEKMTPEGAAIYGSPFIYFGRTGNSFFHGKIVRYEMYNDDKSVYHLWDFQPTNGDRGNMLKNKRADGTVNGSFTLSARNVPDVDDIDPENGFFVTI